MNKKIPLVSYTLVALASVCFMGGLMLISGEGEYDECTNLRSSYQ